MVLMKKVQSQGKPCIVYDAVVFLSLSKQMLLLCHNMSNHHILHNLLLHRTIFSDCTVDTVSLNNL
jgi:hypothetical protein